MTHLYNTCLAEGSALCLRLTWCVQSGHPHKTQKSFAILGNQTIVSGFETKKKPYLVGGFLESVAVRLKKLQDLGGGKLQRYDLHGGEDS